MKYDRKYNELVSRYEKTKAQYNQVCDAMKMRASRSWELDNFIKDLQGQELIRAFDERLWCSLVDFVTINGEDDIWITFKDGTKSKYKGKVM